MSNLTEFSRGKPCQFRIPGVCTHDAARTSPCHIRYANTAGVGQRPNDLTIVHGCDACHMLIDGQTGTIRREEDSWEAYVLAGLCRTLAEVSKEFTVRRGK